MKETAIRFGQSLDQDNFEAAKALLSPACTYRIGDEILVGPEAICDSYKQNMLEGRAKMDLLEWGESSIEQIGDSGYHVHFTDFLTHKGEKYTHRCKQKLVLNAEGLIVEIVHVHDQEEQARLNAFYARVGIS